MLSLILAAAAAVPFAPQFSGPGLEQARLRDAGFAPIEEAAAGGRTVLRVSYMDPILAIRIPGISLVPDALGRASLELTSDGGNRRLGDRVPVERWAAVAADIPVALAPPPAPAAPPAGAPPPRPPPICHAWSAVIEYAEGGRIQRRSAHGCNPTAAPAFKLADALAALAVERLGCPRSDAPAGGDPKWRLAICYGRFDPRTFDSP